MKYMKPILNISIVALNQLGDLRRLLPQLMCNLDPRIARVLLLDNRSTDGTYEYVKNQFPEIEYSFNAGTTGYGGNHNLNLRRSDSKYFLVLNADMIVSSDMIVKLVRHMENDSGIVAATGLVHDTKGEIQGLVKAYPSLTILVIRLLGMSNLAGIFRKLNDRYETRDLGYNVDRDALIISGAFLLVSTAELRAVGGFNERYFLYFEDFDLCMRLKKRGRIRYFCDVQAVHLWHRDAHKSLRHMWWFICSAIRFFLNYGFKLV
jgi:GT2 family glycosyltransferase